MSQFRFKTLPVMFGKKQATIMLGASLLLGMASISQAGQVTRSCSITTVATESNTSGQIYSNTITVSGTAGTVFLARKAASKELYNTSWKTLAGSKAYYWLYVPTDIRGATKKLTATVTGDNGCKRSASTSKTY